MSGVFRHIILALIFFGVFETQGSECQSLFTSSTSTEASSKKSVSKNQFLSLSPSFLNSTSGLEALKNEISGFEKDLKHFQEELAKIEEAPFYDRELDLLYFTPLEKLQNLHFDIGSKILKLKDDIKNAQKKFNSKSKSETPNKSEVSSLKSTVKSLEERIRDLETEQLALVPKIEKEHKIYRAEVLAEIENITKQLLSFQKQKDALEKKLEPLVEAETKRILSKLNAAKKDKTVEAALIDYLSYNSLKEIPDSNRVSLLIGNSEGKVKKTVLAEVQALVQRLVRLNYFIVFDGDSTYAPYISKMVGTSGVGVHTSKQDAIQTKGIAIQNDYLRMKSFATSELSISTPDSLVGTALMLEGEALMVLDSARDFSAKSLDQWNNELDYSRRNLGIIFFEPDVLSNPNRPLSYTKTEINFSKLERVKHKLSAVEEFVPFKLNSIEDYDIASIVSIGNEAINYAQATKKNQDIGGSVFFGSSQKDKHSSALIYESAYRLGRLGYAVVTGGAGGAMETANSGAYNSGGQSVGVPLGGGSTLATESYVAYTKQTLTISTSGYEERIPILLGEGKDSRRLIVFAPGGSGTIKELATTLVRANSKLDSFEKIVFIDKEYYQDLYTWIQNSNLTNSLKEKIILLDSPEEVEALGLKYQGDKEKSSIRKPRLNQPKYIEEKKGKESDKKKSGSGFWLNGLKDIWGDD